MQAPRTGVEPLAQVRETPLTSQVRVPALQQRVMSLASAAAPTALAGQSPTVATHWPVAALR